MNTSKPELISTAVSVDFSRGVVRRSTGLVLGVMSWTLATAERASKLAVSAAVARRAFFPLTILPLYERSFTRVTSLMRMDVGFASTYSATMLVTLKLRNCVWNLVGLEIDVPLKVVGRVTDDGVDRAFASQALAFA